MSGVTRIGWTGTAFKEVVGSPQIRKTDQGPEVTETFHINYDAAEAAIATRGLAFGDDCPVTNGIVTYTDAKLKGIVINKIGPKQGRVVYEWRVPTPIDPTMAPVGSVIKEADANVIDIPIGQNPDATSLNYDEEKKIGKGDWEGIESYLSPQPTYDRTEILGTFTFSEANIIENVGKLFSTAKMGTAGVSAATDKAWLKVGRRIKANGTKFEQLDRWQFAENGWAENIYEIYS